MYRTPLRETERCVHEAVEAGYRLIDTARYHRNGATPVQADLRIKSLVNVSMIDISASYGWN